jgi:hypothetical protein
VLPFGSASDGPPWPVRRTVARPPSRRVRRLPFGPIGGASPAVPSRGCPPFVPSGPPVARPTLSECRPRPSRQTVARPPFRPARRSPGRPSGELCPACPANGCPSAVPPRPPVSLWTRRRGVSRWSAARSPALRPIRPTGCPADPPGGAPRPCRRTVTRPPIRPARRLPGEPSGGLPPALPAHGRPSAVPLNPPVARQVPWIPDPHVAISGGRGAAASKRQFSRGRTRAGGKEPEGRRHEPFGCSHWRPRAPPATSVGRPVSLSTRGFPPRSARSVRRPPALPGTFCPDASRTCYDSAEAKEELQYLFRGYYDFPVYILAFHAQLLQFFSTSLYTCHCGAPVSARPPYKMSWVVGP